MSARRIAFLREVRARRAFLTLAGQKLPRRPRKRLPRQLQPDAQRRAYFAALKRGPLGTLQQLLDARVRPLLAAWASKGQALQARHDHRAIDELYALAVRLDADFDDPNDVVDEMRDAWAAQWTSDRAAQVVQPIAHSINEHQRAQFNRQIKAAMGVDVVRAEPWLQPAVEQFVTENVALIKSIGQEFFPDLEKRLTQGISDGLRQEELADMIQDRYGVAESRAALIARDQTGKFFANLNEQRQAGLGITKYTWRTAGDNRVREEHAEREGEVYSWDDPPNDDYFGPVNPGEAINCRCTAEPVLDEIFADLTGDG